MTAATAADPFAGSDAFGAAGEFRPPASSSAGASPAAAATAAGADPYGAFDGGATFGGSGGGSGRPSPSRGGGRGTSPSSSNDDNRVVPAVVPFNDTPVPPVSTTATAAAPGGSKKNTNAAATGASGSGSGNNDGGRGGGGGRAALLGGTAAPSAGALGGTGSEEPSSSSNSKASVFSLRRHRSHFNVDTADVLSRMRDSIVCIFRPDFLQRVGSSPDLYGPFWIATTLVFLSAVAGNVAAWASWRRIHGGGSGGGSSKTPSPSPSPSSADHPSAWLYDVDKVGYSAALFYGYVAVVGGALFATLRFVFRAPTSSSSSSSSDNNDETSTTTPAITLPAVWCAYGYSLTPFIPVSMLAVIPNEAARWSLIALAAAASGAFLLLNFRGSVYGCAGPKALPTTVAMGCAHAGLAVALKLYIFHYWK